MSQPTYDGQAQDEQERAEWREFVAANQDAWAAEARHEQTQEEYQREWADLNDQYEANHYPAGDQAEI